MDIINMLMKALQMFSGGGDMGSYSNAPKWMTQAPTKSLLGKLVDSSSPVTFDPHMLGHAQQLSLNRLQYAKSWKSKFDELTAPDWLNTKRMITNSQREFFDNGLVNWASEQVTDISDRKRAILGAADESDRFLLRNKTGGLERGIQNRGFKEITKRVIRLADWAGANENLGIGGADYENFQRSYYRYGMNLSSDDKSSEGIYQHQKSLMQTLGMGRKVLGTSSLNETAQALKELTQGTMDFGNPQEIEDTLKKIGAITTGLRTSIPEIVENIKNMTPMLHQAGVLGGKGLELGALLPSVLKDFMKSEATDSVMSKAFNRAGGVNASMQTLMGVLGVNFNSSYMGHAAVAFGEGQASRDTVASGDVTSSHYDRAIDAKARRIMKNSRGKLDYYAARQIAGTVSDTYQKTAFGDMVENMSAKDIFSMSVSSMSDEAAGKFKWVKDRDMRVKAYGSLYKEMGLNEQQMQAMGEITDIQQGGFRGKGKSRIQQQNELNALFDGLDAEVKKLISGELTGQFKNTKPVIQDLFEKHGLNFNLGDLLKRLFGFVENIDSTLTEQKTGLNKTEQRIGKDAGALVSEKMDSISEKWNYSPNF